MKPLKPLKPWTDLGLTPVPTDVSKYIQEELQLSCIIGVQFWDWGMSECYVCSWHLGLGWCYGAWCRACLLQYH